MNIKHPVMIGGGRIFLGVLFAMFLSALVIELLGITGFVPSIYDSSVLVEIHNLRQAATD